MQARIRRIIGVQVGTTLVITLIVLLFAGGVSAASALMGGAIACLTSLLYAWTMDAGERATPQQMLRAHFRAETCKLIATVLLFVAALTLFKGVAVVPLLLTYIAASLLVYWTALLFDK